MAVSGTGRTLGMSHARGDAARPAGRGQIPLRMMPIMMTTIAARRHSTLIPTLDPRGAIVRHREQTDEAIREIRDDASLTDRERSRMITELVAAANARALALWQR